MIYGNQNQSRTISAIVTTYDATVSASTSITLNAATRQILVTAIDKAILLKWGATASTSAFDQVIPANAQVMINRPIDPATGALYTTVQFIEQVATAILIVQEY